jgi:hypothetical protein
MKKDDIKKLLRESLLFENNMVEVEKDEEEKEKEKKEEELASDELTQLKSTLKPWKGNWADVISCMKTSRFNNGDNASQRSVMAKIVSGKYKEEVGEFSKEEADQIIGCMTKLGMGKRKTS